VGGDQRLQTGEEREEGGNLKPESDVQRDTGSALRVPHFLGDRGEL
jgi:hypothetical protein